MIQVSVPLLACGATVVLGGGLVLGFILGAAMTLRNCYRGETD